MECYTSVNMNTCSFPPVHRKDVKFNVGWQPLGVFVVPDLSAAFAVWMDGVDNESDD